MGTDNSATQLGESSLVAMDRIHTGPVPGWVDACPFQVDFKAKEAGHVTHLLVDQQMHAELRQTHFHVALRLDTMQAVQEVSPWRLDFEPGHQQITVHWIKTRRGGAQFDHANLSSARVVDRQAAGPASQERLTLLLMLEDIRPGDILEWCYTVESRPLLLPEHCACLFTLPAGAPVGKFYFSLLFNPTRAMRWKSSVPEWQPVREQNNGSVRWAWSVDHYAGVRPEQNSPDWHIDYPWIQVSDCPDWGTIAAAFAQAWPEDTDDAKVREIAEELADGEGDILQQTERAVRMIQDEYRSLAVDWELDGQPPQPPGLVARRRYGDCKDLSFLLAHLLKRLGVPARLVLVHTVLGKSIAELLPAPGVFNHLLVEYEAGGEKRWVDATHKRQGGGGLRRAMPDHGAGLPLAGPASCLAPPPVGSVPDNTCYLNESILLDTNGAWSWLGVVVAARGSQAAALRQELEDEGLEAFAKKRLRLCAGRFTNARRVGALQYRDDRAANEFFLAETFEIKDFLAIDPKSKWYKLDLANDFIANFLAVPEAGPRYAPFALPHPCHIVHAIELHSAALPPAVVQQRSIETEFLRFTRLRKTLAGYWTMRLTLSTLADAVPPESLEEHRRTLGKIRAQSTWSSLVPAGDRRPYERGDFGRLPLSWNPAFSIPEPASSAPPLPDHDAAKNAAAPPPPSTATPAQPPVRKVKRRRVKRKPPRKERMVKWYIIAGCVLAIALIMLGVWATKNADNWDLFKKRQTNPAPRENY